MIPVPITPNRIVFHLVRGETEPMAQPELSVIVPSVNGMGDLAWCLAALGEQSPPVALQVLVVDRLGGTLPGEVRERFPEVEVLSAPAGTTIPELRRLGFRAARAPAVAVIEDHVIVPPGWARQMLDALERGAVVVGGSITNAATENLTEWAAFLCEYSHCLPPLPAGPSEWLPGNNVVYRRSVLEAHQEAVEAGQWENHLHGALRASGVVLHCDPSIEVGHKKHFTFGEYMSQRYLYSRSYAGARARSAGPLGRLKYGIGALALPPILLYRITSQVLGKNYQRPILYRSLPMIALFTVSWAWGELVGALAGPGDALSRVR
jgi:hypothetical protein